MFGAAHLRGSCNPTRRARAVLPGGVMGREGGPPCGCDTRVRRVLGELVRSVARDVSSLACGCYSVHMEVLSDGPARVRRACGGAGCNSWSGGNSCDEAVSHVWSNPSVQDCARCVQRRPGMGCCVGSWSHSRHRRVATGVRGHQDPGRHRDQCSLVLRRRKAASSSRAPDTDLRGLRLSPRLPREDVRLSNPKTLFAFTSVIPQFPAVQWRLSSP